MLQLEAIGNLGADATIKEFNGQKFIAFNVAHTESYTDQQGQKHENTTWVSCLKFGESKVINYLKKGTSVFVRGELAVKVYTSNGTPQAGVNCKVRELQLFGGSRSEQQAGSNEQPTTKQDSNPVPDSVSNAPFPSTEGAGDLPF